VGNANFFGYANGTARGMFVGARVSIYKVCWKKACKASDVLAAIDQAIADNVNILSLSLGGPARNYFDDIIAIGAFAAIEHGILVSCAAGNFGPLHSTVTNIAPWITTVGSGTLDRDFLTYVNLGNEKNTQVQPFLREVLFMKLYCHSYMQEMQAMMKEKVSVHVFQVA
jgi:hypothetical protein